MTNVDAKVDANRLKVLGSVMRVTNDEIRRRAGVKKIRALVPSATTLDGSCSVNDTKPQPTRGTDLDTKRERKSRWTERKVDMKCRMRA